MLSCLPNDNNTVNKVNNCNKDNPRGNNSANTNQILPRTSLSQHLEATCIAIQFDTSQLITQAKKTDCLKCSNGSLVYPSVNTNSINTLTYSGALNIQLTILASKYIFRFLQHFSDFFHLFFIFNNGVN